MTTWSDAFSSRTTHLLELVVTETSTDPGANTSVVTAVLQINPPSDSSSWNLYSTQNNYSLSFNGTNYTGTYTFDFRTNRATKVLRTFSATITHATNGTGSVTAAGSAHSDTLGDASITTKTFTLTDFTRVPSTPGVSASRTDNGATVNVNSGTATFYGTGGSYQWIWSYDNTNWNGPYALDGSRNGSASVVATSPVYVQTRAVDSEGNGAWSGSATTAGIPTAPQAITTAKSGRNVTVTISGSASDGGSTITLYQVQYNTGSGWTGTQNISSGTYTYSSLPAAQTYTFRAYAVNAIGSSDVATSAGVYIAAGGKRYNGSAFVSTATAKRWTGSAWTDVLSAKRWNGSAWIDLS